MAGGGIPCLGVLPSTSPRSGHLHPPSISRRRLVGVNLIIVLSSAGWQCIVPASAAPLLTNACFPVLVLPRSLLSRVALFLLCSSLFPWKRRRGQVKNGWQEGAREVSRGRNVCSFLKWLQFCIFHFISGVRFLQLWTQNVKLFPSRTLSQWGDCWLCSLFCSSFLLVNVESSISLCLRPTSFIMTKMLLSPWLLCSSSLGVFCCCLVPLFIVCWWIPLLPRSSVLSPLLWEKCCCLTPLFLAPFACGETLFARPSIIGCCLRFHRHYHRHRQIFSHLLLFLWHHSLWE